MLGWAVELEFRDDHLTDIALMNSAPVSLCPNSSTFLSSSNNPGQAKEKDRSIERSDLRFTRILQSLFAEDRWNRRFQVQSILPKGQEATRIFEVF